MSKIYMYRVSDLTEKKIKDLAVEIQPIFTLFSPRGKNIKEVIEKIKNGFDSRLIIQREAGRVMGFITYDVYWSFGVKVCHFGGVIVNPEFRSRGVFTGMFEVMLQEACPDYLSLLTQNPQVYATVLRFSKYVLPDVSSMLKKASNREFKLLEKLAGKGLTKGDIPVLFGVYKHLLPVPDKSVGSEKIRNFFSDILGEYDSLCMLARV